MHVGLISFVDIEYALDVANALNELGISVTLYLSHARTARVVGSPDRPVERLYELKLLPPACRVRLLHLPRMRDPRSFFLIRKLIRIIRNDEVDLIHILVGPGEIWLAVLACFLRSIPVVSTMIIPKPNVGEDLPAFVLLGVNKLLAYGSDLVIVNGEDQVGVVQKLYGLPASRVAYVPLNPRTTSVKWAEKRNFEESGTVLFFGRAHPHKGLEYLMRAQPIISHHVPHARIVISGYGWTLERCRQMIQDSSKFEIHEGFVPPDVMAALFERASLVALPYISASTSGVLLTAYGFGKPVVATSVGCLPEYVKDGVTGLLVPPCDVEKLADAIIRLLSDDVLRHRMGDNAAAWVYEQQENVALQTQWAYERVIAIHRKI